MGLYQPLKVYLMLGGRGPMDTGTVKSWVALDWAREQFPGADRAPVRKELAEHLDALLDDPGLSSSWPGGRQAPLDGTTIASARAALATLSLADRAYAVLKQKALSSDGSPWRASAALAAGDSQAFANGTEVLQLEVPFFFTRRGYEQAYQIGLTTIAADIEKDIWVLGDAAGTEGVKTQMSQIRPGVASLYARDYIAAWEHVATAPKPANYFGDAAALGAFTKTPSPLKLLLTELRQNTSFAGGSAVVGGMVATGISSSRFGRAADAARAVSGPANVDAGTEISNYFKPLHEYVGDGKAPGPVDEFIAAVKQAGSAVISAKLARGGIGSDAVQGQMAMAMGSVAAAAGGAPPQLQGFVAAATSGGSKASADTAQGAIADAYAQSILPNCRSATQDKYPFFGTAKDDASLVDVQQVFGMGGPMDSFLQQRIIPLLDMSGPVWRWSANNAMTTSLSPSSPDEFVKARQMRDLLVAPLALKFEAKAFGAGIDSVELTVGGTQYLFEGVGSGERPVSWSAQATPQASLTMLSAKAKVADLSATGPWALFRLMDKARLENAGARTILATFGSGSQTAVFKVSLPGDQNPFSRGGLWSFRCPVTL